jgi:hypothetical protein
MTKAVAPIDRQLVDIFDAAGVRARRAGFCAVEALRA